MVRSNYSVCILDEDLEKGKRVLGNNFLVSTLILYIPGHASLFPTLPGPSSDWAKLVRGFQDLSTSRGTLKVGKRRQWWAETTVTAR